MVRYEFDELQIWKKWALYIKWDGIRPYIDPIFFVMAFKGRVASYQTKISKWMNRFFELHMKVWAQLMWELWISFFLLLFIQFEILVPWLMTLPLVRKSQLFPPCYHLKHYLPRKFQQLKIISWFENLAWYFGH